MSTIKTITVEVPVKVTLRVTTESYKHGEDLDGMRGQMRETTNYEVMGIITPDNDELLDCVDSHYDKHPEEFMEEKPPIGEYGSEA